MNALLILTFKIGNHCCPVNRNNFNFLFLMLS